MHLIVVVEDLLILICLTILSLQDTWYLRSFVNSLNWYCVMACLVKILTSKMGKSWNSNLPFMLLDIVYRKFIHPFLLNLCSNRTASNTIKLLVFYMVLLATVVKLKTQEFMLTRRGLVNSTCKFKRVYPLLK